MLVKILSFRYGGSSIDFEANYSFRRRTIQISIPGPGRVVVRAPAGQPDRELIRAVSGKADWITRKLALVAATGSQPATLPLSAGRRLLFLGRSCPIQLDIEKSLKKPVIDLTGDQFLIRVRSGDQVLLRSHLLAWYRKKAEVLISERVRLYSGETGLKPKSIHIKDQKKRWGSCSAKGNLNFNWRCVMAPAPVIDYVVIHELCHLAELNHSARFWSLVRRIMPEYEARKSWLKIHGAELFI